MALMTRHCNLHKQWEEEKVATSFFETSGRQVFEIGKKTQP
jgi:hypothetical protein